MQKLAGKDLWCSYGKVRLSFSDKARNEEKQPLLFVAKALRKQDQIFCKRGFPVTFFMWKLIDYTTITVTKKPQLLQKLQEKVENFHKDKNAVANKIREFI